MTPMRKYIQEANEQTFVLIQVEEPHAVERAEEILAVPGVDMLMLGPADFSVLTGIPGEFTHPTVVAAIERIARAARNTGKHWAATCGGVEVARRMIEMGARLVFHGCDIVFVKKGLDSLQTDFGKELGMRFARSAALQADQKSYLEGK
jgi:4-hydroxy-2-oxoheptanedioate aldolase